ncbi:MULTISPECIES: shikimate dehydrogenase [unclassified Arthrobacter]|uniref:shikimate dehydrogenase family protein n=1 Tax=unclassified Arthrobacter TaxID=235627 RepID=UPI0024DFC09B|nr:MULTISPECIES: shikimate dehydrogenase [unclassified Arthrobacter]MCC9145539.1 shikimate dehydrogenase [Arthrobacter sp. zg-Y919]MDK1276768.1 shikimate dehydrogenase [Arthrobacter sp. zg.Y919]WIB04290.1 shikimate dehydrogenase [Arthrobacter sp. zg-Y919]
MLGHPISHSKSPLLHRAAYAHLGWECRYDAIDLREEEAAAFAASLRAEAGWTGLSVTMPLKAAMVAHMDQIQPLVRALGVLNTVTFAREGGRTVLTGHNTDVAGIVGALRNAGMRDRPRAVVLGSGGTACAAVAALAQVDPAGGVDVCARRFPEAGVNQAGVVAAGAAVGTTVNARPWAEAAAACAGADVVVSTLPPHGADRLAEELAGELAAVQPGAVLLDAAYDPWPSRLASAWAGLGGVVAPGIEMLLYQAVEQVKLFTGDAFCDEPGVINAMCDAVGIARR